MLAQADQLVVLADDLGRALGEVQRKGGLVGTKVVDVEDELLRQVFRGSPDDPANTRVDEAVPISISMLGNGEGARGAYLWPEVLMEITFSSLKSHSRSGTTNGATNPPEAASMWMTVSMLFLTRRSLTALASSYSPV